MPSPEQDIEFLEACLKKAQKFRRDFFELLPCDVAPVSNDGLPPIDEEAERVACLADAYGLDGNLFRSYLIPRDTPLSLQQLRQLDEEIKTIARIIAKIKKAVETERTETTEPTDLIDLTKALTRVHISRSQIKRDIYQGKIKTHRKHPRGKHRVSLAEIQKVYLTK